MEEARRREEEKKEQERLEAERREQERRASAIGDPFSPLEEEQIRKKQAEERAKLRHAKKTLLEKWSEQIDKVPSGGQLFHRTSLQAC